LVAGFQAGSQAVFVLAPSIVAREEFGYRWDRGTIWLERVIDFAGKAGLGWGFLQFAIPI
jgi:predicted glycosyl hydrolase (DUF1957 family)